MSVTHALRRDAARQEKRQREESDAHDARDALTDTDETAESCESRLRRKRKVPEGGYSEAARRPRQARAHGPLGYMERGTHGGQLKRKGIAVGPAVVHRGTRGQYDWRDAAMPMAPGDA